MKKSHVATTIGGMLVAAYGIYRIEAELHGDLFSERRFWVWIAVFGLGLFICFPGLVKEFFKTVIVVVPTLKFGNRQEDIPLAKAPPTAKPGDVAKIEEIKDASIRNP